MDVIARIERRTAIAERGHETPCYVWTGYRDRDGYGLIGERRGMTRRIHRLTWEATHGPIPASLELDHLCRQPDCHRVSHMELVTHAENVRRGGRAQQTHCKYGHALAGDNLITRTVKRGQRTYRLRECRACAIRRAREQTARNRTHLPA